MGPGGGVRRRWGHHAGGVQEGPRSPTGGRPARPLTSGPVHTRREQGACAVAQGAVSRRSVRVPERRCRAPPRPPATHPRPAGRRPATVGTSRSARFHRCARAPSAAPGPSGRRPAGRSRGCCRSCRLLTPIQKQGGMGLGGSQSREPSVRWSSDLAVACRPHVHERRPVSTGAEGRTSSAFPHSRSMVDRYGSRSLARPRYCRSGICERAAARRPAVRHLRRDRRLADPRTRHPGMQVRLHEPATSEQLA